MMEGKQDINWKFFIASCLFIIAVMLFMIKIVFKSEAPKKKKVPVEYTYSKPVEVKPINDKQKDYYEAVYADSIVKD